MNWLSYIFPQTIERRASVYHREIRINEERGRYKLLANGARESGAYIEGLWRYALRNLGFTGRAKTKNILVLGIAGGTVIHLLHNLYPDARIIGVDIDAVMIEVGKKYFGLDTMKNLRCVCADAAAFAASYKGTRFDLVVVDIFVGPDIPDFVPSAAFERNVKKHVSAGGCVLINYLRQPGYEEKVAKLQKVLQTLYNNVGSADIHNNRFFLAQ